MEEVNGVAQKVSLDSGFAKWSVLQALPRRHASIISTAIARRITPDGSFKTLRASWRNCGKRIVNFFCRGPGALPENGRGWIPETTGVGGTPGSPGKKLTINCNALLCSVSSNQSIRFSIREKISNCDREKEKELHPLNPLSRKTERFFLLVYRY